MQPVRPSLMAIFTAARLIDLCPQPMAGTLTVLASSLEEHAASVGVDTLLRRAHFIAQVAHESGGFRRFVENLNYSAHRIEAVWPRLAPRAQALANKPEALGNAAYADRMGNGTESSGDGWRYRGRGLIQLTGRDNYRAAGSALDIDLIVSPQRADEPADAVRIALWFWGSRKCNDAADLDDVAQVTRLINGGLTGLVDRQRLTTEAKRIFTDPAEALIA
jgi:putative chitinase